MTTKRIGADIELEPLLESILHQGWTEEDQRAFLESYGTLLRRSVLYQLRCHFGGGSLQAAHAYLQSAQTGRSLNLDPELGIDAESVELALNTWQDVLTDVFSSDPRDGLIGKYVEYLKRHDQRPSFDGFLRQSVRYKFLDNLPYKLSPKQIFDRIVDLELPESQHHYIRLAKDRFSEPVREKIRDRSENLSGNEETNAVHYFFERFVPEEYPRLRPSLRSQRKAQSDVLPALLERFSNDRLRAGAQYRPEIHGTATSINHQGDTDDSLERVGRVDEVSVGDDVDVYWDLLLRCQRPSHHDVNRDLTALRADRTTALCWACAKLKSESPRHDTRENLIAFIAFYCSQRGPQRTDNELPVRDRLSLESIEGLYLRWDEDVCDTIFQKSIRKDRVMDMIVKTLRASEFHHLLPPSTPAEGTGHD